MAMMAWMIAPAGLIMLTTFATAAFTISVLTRFVTSEMSIDFSSPARP